MTTREILSETRERVERVANIVRRIIGVPDYDRYVAHLHAHNPEMTAAPEHTHTLISATGTFTIGREASSQLVLNHQSISRHHAAITCANGSYFLRDMRSRNGTFINETRLEPDREYLLKPRDHIRIGNMMSYQFLLRPIAPGK